MAAPKGSNSNRPRFFYIPIAQIDPPTANPRFEATDLKELAQSIREVGILEPLICKAKANGHVELVAGKRRLASAKLAKISEAPCIVHPALDFRQELAVSLVENLHRQDMSIIEEGEAFVKLRDTGMTIAQVARMVGISHQKVQDCIRAATNLIPAAREAAHIGKLGRGAAADLAKHDHETQRAIFLGQRRVIERTRTGPSQSRAELALRRAATSYRLGKIKPALDYAREAVAALEETVARLENDQRRVHSALQTAQSVRDRAS